MKCSDCKYFKTDECTVNPEGKDCDSAESFSCFKSSAGAELQNASTATGSNSKKTRGIGLFWIGIAGFILSFILLSEANNEWPDLGGVFGVLIAIVVVVSAFLMTIAGGILFLVGNNEEKRRGKQCGTHDSSSDYNKTIKIS